MSRTLLNFLLDTLLLILFLALVWCSLVVRFVFPPGPNAAGWQLWGHAYDAWSGFQFALVAAMLLAVVLHVMLHWTWICGVVTRRLGGGKTQADDGVRTLYGVGLLASLLLLLGVAFFAAKLAVQSPSDSAGSNSTASATARE